jgi:hypothetical protein
MPLISITRLRVRSWRFLSIFFVYALRSSRQAAASDGNLGTELLRDRKMTFWTATSWSTEAAMKAFMHAGVHGPVMKRLPHWCDEAAVAHWTQDGPDLPSWDEAYRRLRADGRRSKVNHPSAAHTAFEIPAPRIGRGSATRVK